VTITGRNPERLHDAVRELGDAVLGVAGDAGSWEHNEELVAAHVERFGGCDAVVANAGFGGTGDFSNADPAAWESMLRTNVLGPAFLVRAAFDALESSRGSVVLIGSVAGTITIPGSFYGVTKHAVGALARNLRAQAGPAGIRVALVAPGVVDTLFWPGDGNPYPFALEPDAVTRTIRWVLDQPADVSINEVVVRPTTQTM
jgi:NADP-dependent 3-hydroxy acid dehydrogenase YdfG